jgi:acetylglutamate kinase
LDTKELIKKANILVEALPYIRSFYGKTFVIKYGGAAQTEEALKHAFAQDVVLMSYIGIRPIVVHGGGPRISATMKKMGKKPSFVDGHRVTDEETMDIVEMVLGGLVNKQIVSLINAHGGRAVGLSGKDGGLIKAKKKRISKSDFNEDEYIDIGFVGEVTEVCPDALVSLDRDGFVPVISPVGTGSKGETLNINADEISSAIATSLKAEKLIFLTDVGGIKDKKDNVLSTLSRTQAKKLITSKTIAGGMLPKVKAALNAVEGGVKKTHIVDGRVPHCLLLEIFTQEGIGTEIVGKA